MGGQHTFIGRNMKNDLINVIEILIICSPPICISLFNRMSNHISNHSVTMATRTDSNEILLIRSWANK